MTPIKIDDTTNAVETPLEMPPLFKILGKKEEANEPLVTIPIYEILAPEEVFLLAKEGDKILYITNKHGRAELKRAEME